jgi:tetratricopeptide (TPR) repeat protein
VTRIGVSVVVLMALSLGGCQTSDKPFFDLSSSDVAFASQPPHPHHEPKLEDDFLLNNEPRRIAEVYFERGYYGNAERSYRKAVELNPADVDAWLGLGASYDNLGRFDLADRAYGHAGRNSGVSIKLLNNHGYSFLLRGDFRKAEEMFLRAQRLDPSNMTIHNNLVLVQRARADLGPGVKFNPKPILGVL